MPVPYKKSVTPYAFLSVGFEFIIIFLFFCGIGFAGDTYSFYYWNWHTKPLGLLVGLFFGFIAGTWHIYHRCQDLNARLQKEEQIANKEQKVRPSNTEHIKNLSAEIETIRKKLDQTLPKKDD